MNPIGQGLSGRGRGVDQRYTVLDLIRAVRQQQTDPTDLFLERRVREFAESIDQLSARGAIFRRFTEKQTQLRVT